MKNIKPKSKPTIQTTLDSTILNGTGEELLKMFGLTVVSMANMLDNEGFPEIITNAILTDIFITSLENRREN